MEFTLIQHKNLIMFFFFLLLVMVSNFLIIPVVREKIKVKPSLAIPTGAQQQLQTK